MEHEDSLSYTKDLATAPHSEANESIPPASTLLRPILVALIISKSDYVFVMPARRSVRLYVCMEQRHFIE